MSPAAAPGCCPAISLLAEANAGVAQPQILAVVLAGKIKIILPLHIEPTALPEQVGVIQVVHVALDRIVVAVLGGKKTYVQSAFALPDKKTAQ